LTIARSGGILREMALFTGRSSLRFSLRFSSLKGVPRTELRLRFQTIGPPQRLTGGLFSSRKSPPQAPFLRAFSPGEHLRLFHQISQFRNACGATVLKPRFSHFRCERPLPVFNRGADSLKSLTHAPAKQKTHRPISILDGECSGNIRFLRNFLHDRGWDEA
jgi:hypothetical protein